MKNLIYACVFNNDKYLILLFLLLESIQLFGKLEDTTYGETELLIYTSTAFSEIIRQHPLYNEKIRFFINDNYNTIDLALKARLDIFDYPHLNEYNRILYLDTDILILKNITTLFGLIEENVIYALQEGDLISDKGCYMYGGLALFTEEEIESYEDKSCFTSCTMLFNNCDEIRNLFSIIKNHITIRNIQFGTGDQPYIVYNAMKHKLYNNKKLTPFIQPNVLDVSTEITINHFGGYAGHPHFKLEHMPKFLNDFKVYSESKKDINE